MTIVAVICEMLALGIFQCSNIKDFLMGVNMSGCS